MMEASKIDLKDRRILLEIERDCRQPYRRIGKAVGVHPDSVRYRVDRLKRRGVIHSYLTYVNFSRLGFTDYGIFFRAQRLTSKEEGFLISFLEAHPYVSYVSRLGGQYDFIIAVLAKDVSHFNRILGGIMEKIGGYILDKEISIRVDLVHFPKTYLEQKKQRDIRTPLTYFGKEYGVEMLDKTDFSLLSTISNRADLSLVEIGKQIHIPTSTVLSRLTKLKKRGIIIGYFAFTSPQAIGYQAYDVMIKLKNPSPQKEKEFETFLGKNAYIVYMLKTIGKWDREFSIEVPDQQTFQTVLSEIRERFDELIQSLEFVVIFKDIKYNLFPFSAYSDLDPQ